MSTPWRMRRKNCLDRNPLALGHRYDAFVTKLSPPVPEPNSAMLLALAVASFLASQEIVDDNGERQILL